MGMVRLLMNIQKSASFCLFRMTIKNLTGKRPSRTTSISLTHMTSRKAEIGDSKKKIWWSKKKKNFPYSRWNKFFRGLRRTPRVRSTYFLSFSENVTGRSSSFKRRY